MSKISELSDGGSLQSTDYLIAVRSGGNVKVQADGNLTLGTVTADGLTVQSGVADVRAGDVGPSGNASINIGRDDTTITGGNPLGYVQFLGSDNTAGSLTAHAYIGGIAAASHSAGNNPTELVFGTTASGSETILDRLKIADNGDISFYEDTGTTPKFFWDASAESLGLGTTSPANKLHVEQSVDGDLLIEVDNPNTGASAAAGLYLNGQGNNFFIKNYGDGTAKANITEFTSSASGSQFVFSLNAEERARLDASGNLLVGKTATNYNNDGFQAFSGGFLHATGTQAVANSGTIATLNRKSTDGSIVDFRKDGSAVGSIVARAGNLAIGTGNTGLRFSDSDRTIYPFDSTVPNEPPAVISLGDSGSTFKDLFLSGGVYLGGTGAANLLDDYETGTFTASTLTGETSGSVTIQSTLDTLAYTKVGRLVTITGRLRVSSASSPVGDYVTLTLPFTSSQLVEEAGYAGGCSIYSDDGSATWNAMPCRVQENTTTMELYLPLASIDSDYRLEFNFSYLTG